MKSFIKYLWVITFLVLTATFVKSQDVETVIQTGHYAAISNVCYSGNGKFIATASDDKTIKLWNAADGKEIRTFFGISSHITHLEFNYSVTYLLAVLSDGIILVWEVNSGKEIKHLSLPEDQFTCASFHPSEFKIVAGTKKSHIGIWNLETGLKTLELIAVPQKLPYFNNYEYEESETVSFSADGKFVVSGMADFTSILWDSASGKEIRKYKASDNNCTSCFTQAAITSDNKYIISAASDSVEIFDRESGKFLKAFKNHGSGMSSLSLSANNKVLAFEEYSSAQVWDLEKGKFIGEFKEPSEKRIKCVALSPDGKHLVTGNDYRTADIWDITSGKKIISLKGYLNQVDENLLDKASMFWASLMSETRLSSDGKYIAAGRNGNNVKLIDFNTGEIHSLKGHTGMVISLAFSNDSKYLATGGMDGKILIYSMTDFSVVKELNYVSNAIAVFSVDISSDNRYLAASDWGGYVVIWDLETGKPVKSIYPHGGMASYHVKFTPGGYYVISAGLDHKLKLLEVDTGEEIRCFTGHTDLVNSINTDPAGNKIITSSWDGTFRVWDLLSGLQTLKVKAHNIGTYCAKFDNTGKFIISGGDDRLVKLWDASTGTLLNTFTGHKGGVGDVNLSPDHKYVVSGSRDGNIKIWDTESKQELLSVMFINDNDWFMKNPEGYFDASKGAFNSVSFVHGTTIYGIEQFFTEFYQPGLYKKMFDTEKISLRDNINNTIGSYPPPAIEIITPGNNETNSEKPDITAMIKITCKGGGVKDLKILQNGKRLNIDDAELKRLNKDGQYIIKTVDLDLVPGRNDFTVSAFSQGDIESAGKSFTISYKGISKTSNCYIVSIGINKYKNENLNLSFARPDAEAFSDLVNRKSKKLFDKVYVYNIVDGDATKENIFNKFKEITQKMKKEDVFIFFYAGHGSMIDDNFYFITANNVGLYQSDKLKEAISARELQEQFKLLPALKQVVLIDACHSGSSVSDLAMRGGPGEEKALAQLSRSSGVHVMASSESQQQSAEIKSLGHGVFTWVLLQALEGKADGSPKDSKITVYELKSYIDDQVPEVSYQLIKHKQFPNTFSIGQDFPLVME